MKDNRRPSAPRQAAATQHRAPQAQQVADRFHLLVNLSATMERVLEVHSRQLILPPVAKSAAAPQAKVGDFGKDPQPPRATQAQQRRQRRLARYRQVVVLFRSGQSQVAISRALGIGRKTIRRWLRRGEFPERKPPHRAPAKVSEFAAYLQQRWNEGCHNAYRLYQEICQQGYRGKRSMVARLVAQWRKPGKAYFPQGFRANLAQARRASGDPPRRADNGRATAAVESYREAMSNNHRPA